MPSPWDTYAEALKEQGYGYPLWYPGCPGEVELGDVGYIENGRFCRLFNVLEKELNKHEVPKSFEPLDLPEEHYQTNNVTEPMIVTGNIAKIQVDADVIMYVCHISPVSNDSSLSYT